MSQKVQRMSSTLMSNENTAYLNWIKQKDEQKFKEDQLKLYDENKKKIEARIEEEKRRVLNEISYWKWFDKKSNELKEKKLMEEQKEKERKEMEMFEKRNQMIKDIKFNEWLEKKLSEEKMKKEQLLIEKQEKNCENEIQKFEKEKARYVWELWSENKDKKIKEEKLKKEKEQQDRLKEKEEKRKLSEQKFQEWMAKVANRPRPVRSNQGFTSLSCSNIGYVNPEPWKNILDDKTNCNEDSTNNYDKMFRILYKKPSNLKFNNSYTTVKTYEDGCDNALQRTADWVKHTSTQNITMKQIKVNESISKNNESVISNNLMQRNNKNLRNSKSNIIRLDRNKSAPVFMDDKRKSLINLTDKKINNFSKKNKPV